MATPRGRSKRRGAFEVSLDSLPLRSSGRQAKKKAAETTDEDEDGSSEKKYRKCEKAGCTAMYPVCFASASERCAKNGYTSRWYHLSCGEHFCNECFDHYYRSHKDGYDTYMAWKRVWTSNGKTEPSPAQGSIFTSGKSLWDTQFPDEHTWDGTQSFPTST